MKAESETHYNIDITLNIWEGDNIQFIDPNIRGLVLSINGLGIETRASSDGHLDKKKYPYPWISAKPFLYLSHQDRLDRLSDLLEEFNQDSEIEWEFLGQREINPSMKTLKKFGLSRSKRRPKSFSESDLSTMHQSARELAKFLAKAHLSDVQRTWERKFHLHRAGFSEKEYIELLKEDYRKAGVDL